MHQVIKGVRSISVYHNISDAHRCSFSLLSNSAVKKGCRCCDTMRGISVPDGFVTHNIWSIPFVNQSQNPMSLNFWRRSMWGPMTDVLLREHIIASTPQNLAGDFLAIVSFITVAAIFCFISVEHYYLEECWVAGTAGQAVYTMCMHDSVGLKRRQGVSRQHVM